ncbi:MAG: hypothetical protein WCG07_03360 [Candidatus Taylorbacteria bacterium]
MKKIRGSVYGPSMFAKASWPFGSIQVDSDKIIFKGFPFTNEVIDKSSIKKISNSVFFGGLSFDYTKDGTDKNIKFSSMFNSDLTDTLEKLGYIIS